MLERDSRSIRFTFICNTQERQLITAIAERLQRSQGDAIRILIYRVADEMGIGNEVGELGRVKYPEKIFNQQV